MCCTLCEHPVQCFPPCTHFSTDLRNVPPSSIQVIAVGPVIELYGRFAAEKFARL
ncbi:hypothetical protein F5050DRAFT_1795574, partial [Lentinula boryana]